MKSRSALALVLSFAAGLVLAAAIGGATGFFDRGPSDQDVLDARQRGRSEATEQVDIRMQSEAEDAAERGLDRGRESVEWLFLDRLPNPDSWFAGVKAGRADLQALADDAFAIGQADGERQGRDQALGAVRD